MFSNGNSGWSADASTELVDNAGIDSMFKLSNITKLRAKDIAKNIRMVTIGLLPVPLTVHKEKVHNIVMTGVVANDNRRVLWDINCATMTTVFDSEWKLNSMIPRRTSRLAMIMVRPWLCLCH